MYAEKLKQFENVENLGGKAWEHAVIIDLAEKSGIKDCSMHCFHYQQMFELLFKHILETRTKYGAYPHTHKLNKLLEQICEDTTFKTNVSDFLPSLRAITACAEIYRYNFLIDCKSYWEDVLVLNALLEQLILFLLTE